MGGECVLCRNKAQNVLFSVCKLTRLISTECDKKCEAERAESVSAKN